MSDHHANALVEFLAKRADFPSLARDRVLLPTVGNCLKKRNQGGGRGENDAVLDAQFYQLGIDLKRRAEDRLVGDKEDHKLRGVLKLTPILLLREALDVFTDVAGMTLQLGGFCGGIALFQCFQVGCQWHFRIHDHLSLVGQANEHVGT